MVSPSVLSDDDGSILPDLRAFVNAWRKKSAAAKVAAALLKQFRIQNSAFRI